MSYYVGLLDGAGKVWGVRVPDLPGAHGGGATPEAAMADATSAVREWAELLGKSGGKLPTPRGVAAIKSDKQSGYTKNDAIVMIPLILDAGRSVRANLSVDAGQLAAIDAEAERRGVTRSAFLVGAAMEKILQAR